MTFALIVVIALLVGLVVWLYQKRTENEIIIKAMDNSLRVAEASISRENAKQTSLELILEVMTGKNLDEAIPIIIDKAETKFNEGTELAMEATRVSNEAEAVKEISAIAALKLYEESLLLVEEEFKAATVDCADQIERGREAQATSKALTDAVNNFLE
jgi:hypothetical protein